MKATQNGPPNQMCFFFYSKFIHSCLTHCHGLQYIIHSENSILQLSIIIPETLIYKKYPILTKILCTIIETTKDSIKILILLNKLYRKLKGNSAQKFL